ncbi:MAG: ribosome maturation factor RimP [Bryobacteraceae bacterium]|nr:ribosome maturation factor RimP [Bryobacteraceae bacterium]
MAQTSREAVIARVTEIVERVGIAEQIEVVEAELAGGGKSRLLRIYIDKPGGVTLGDCEFISREAGAVFDEEEVIPGGTYNLEVSSPGVERKLIKPSDFQRFSGQKARVILAEPVEEQNQWEGTLRGIDQANVIALEPSEGRLVHIPLDSVRKANLKFEW